MAKQPLAFVIPYFGQFNNYFQLFLESCRRNHLVDFLLFTDDDRLFDYPPNVHVIPMDFLTFRARIAERFPFPIRLETPRKLCDYKPAWGYCLQEELAPYDYWGFCDTDLIFGDIIGVLGEENLEQYDKIGVYGHMNIFRNTPEVNSLFMKTLSGVERYKEAFTSDSIVGFDEDADTGVHAIFLENHRKCLANIPVANIYQKDPFFRLTAFDFETGARGLEPRSDAFFVYKDGTLTRYIRTRGGASRFIISIST